MTLGPFALDAIYAADCIEAMRRLPDKCVDVAIADPPYNASKGNEWKWDHSVALPGFGGDWRKVSESWDAMPLPEYVGFTVAWLSELQRVVRPTGSVWIHGTYHNIGIINFVLQTLGVEIINEVVWYKRNAFPNLAGRRLTASHETILWAHTGGKRREYYFDYEGSKALECPEDALRAPGKQLRTVWDIPNNKARGEIAHGKHPTQKPLRLLTRMLALSARPGGCCLVPFSGSGSECVAAARLGLRYLGFETDPVYVALAERRLAAERGGAVAAAAAAVKAMKATKTAKAAKTAKTAKTAKAAKPAKTAKSAKAAKTAKAAKAAKPEPKAKPAKKAKAPAPPKVAIPSLVKWTGSKRAQAATLRELVPEHGRYFEPFLGGGALLYLTARPGSVAGDLYGPLVDLWRLVQETPDALVEDYRGQWARLQADLPGYFYAVRERFNAGPNPADLNFLMRTCVNGIVRFNREGGFNNSFHLSRPGMHPERFAPIVEAWHGRLGGVTLRCGDYAETVAEARAGDLVYLDPPYAGSRNRYVADLDVARFFGVLEALNGRGVRWMLSFDGERGGRDLSHPVPPALYQRRVLVANGHSAVGKVLNGPVERVAESLYLSF